VQRIKGFAVIEPLGGHVALAEGRHAEINEGVLERGVAESAANAAL
jgi:hypothetical protein